MFNPLRGLLWKLFGAKTETIVVRYDQYPTQEQIRIDVLCLILGINIGIRDDFFEDSRIDRAFNAMFAFGEKEIEDIDPMLNEFWHNASRGEDFATALVALIDKHMVLEPDDPEDSLSIQRVFWQTHGMGYEPGELYPFLTESSAVFRHARNAIGRASLITPVRPDNSVNRDTVVLANLICGSVLSGKEFTQAVDDAFMSVCFSNNQSITRHDAEWLFDAKATFWLTFQRAL